MSEMNQTWVLRHRPVGEIKAGDLEIVETPLEPLQDGQVRAKTIYLSLDPTNRIWMSDMDAYLPPVQIGDGMRGGGLAVVTESRHGGFQQGDVVNTGLGTWTMYPTLQGDGLAKLPILPGVPLTAYMGPLGATGMTAYFGLMDIGKPKPGETVVVSAAAGAVGSMVGQIAKIQGCRVVGIAGSDDKCKWLTDVAGFDAAINYKKEDVGAALDKHCPNGIDVNFENVGGQIMDQVIARLNDFSRMPLCGLISTYNDTTPAPGPSNFANFLMRRTLVKGFIVIDYFPRFPEGIQQMAQWLMEGKLKFETDVVKGFENAPSSLSRLFEGKNLGKLVVECSPPPA
ncbi:MAG: NADP-dependent oxidoreductase [Hyphomonadaceae bacterium BRH_c29]|nr:MAG: NADP-dependent oxidoreductase [Hyphomonadaceae bacterium BRH_c29]